MEVSYEEQRAWDWAYLRCHGSVSKDVWLADLDGEHEDILVEMHTEYGHMEYGEKQCYGGYQSLLSQLRENAWKYSIVMYLF